MFTEIKQPKEIVKRIVPKWNQFLFFEVTPQSFHQVSEIVRENKLRLTVHGWFRGPNSNFLIEPYIELPLMQYECGDVDVDEEVFREWINPRYLESDIQLQIQEDFATESSINLPEFLKFDKFLLLSDVLNRYQAWKKTGPPNRRNFEVLDEDNCPSIIKHFLDILKSQAMFLTLSNLTGIKLHPLVPDPESSEDEAGEDDDLSSDDDNNVSSKNKIAKIKEPTVSSPRCSIQIRKWQNGYYSLIHDHDPEVINETFKLDAILHLNHDFKTNRQEGGFVSYITKGEDEELICVEPESNYLSLAYLDPTTVRFVKYLNHSHPQPYHDVSMIFQE